MAARHRARATVIQILKVQIIPSSQCKRPHMKQLMVNNFPTFLCIKKYVAVRIASIGQSYMSFFCGINLL